MTLITANPTILIVDDSPSNLSVVVTLFEERGYRVAIAQDGEEGLQRALLLKPDLILLDVMMPGKDGFEVCRQLKADEETQDTPVIFMTALTSAEHKVKAFQAGAVDYVTKPLQIDEVMARVDTHVNLYAAQKRLAEQNEQLEKHREELERRVIERTAELAARESEFRTLAENLPDNLARYDKQCRTVYTNQMLESILGEKTDKMRGKTPLEMRQGPIYIEYQACLAQTIATGSSSEMELVLPDTGNGVHYHHIRFVAECDANGIVVGALAIGRDITASKQAESLLHEQEQAIRAVVENSPDAHARYDRQLRRIYVNPATHKLLDLPLEQILGKTPEAGVVLPEEYISLIESVFESGEEIRIEMPFRWVNGSRGWGDVRIVPEFGPDGRVVTVLAIGRDITVRKRAERELEESQAQLRGLTAQREAAREEERKYIAREVHDELGQILTGLQLNISVLNHKLTPGQGAMKVQLQDTMKLTDRALEVARNVASALRPSALEMGIVAALEWLTGRFGANTGICCKLHIDEGDIQLDEPHAIALFRIVQESLTNVSRHAKADRVDVTLRRESGDYVLKVRDNGTGFDAMEKKSDSFGLVGIRERVLMLGGKVEIDSHPGKGTEIIVRIPVQIISEES